MFKKQRKTANYWRKHIKRFLAACGVAEGVDFTLG